MKNKFSDLRTAAATLCILLLMTGCALEPNTITRENYDKLKFGMTYEEVTAIIGEPEDFSTRTGIKQYTWVEKGRHIHSKFLAGRAIYYSSRGLDPKQTAEIKPATH